MEPKKVDYEVILVICLILLLFYFLTDIEYLAYASMGIGLVSLLVKPIGRILVKGWNVILKGIGYVNSRVILALVFFIILLPIALLARVFRKVDPLKLKQNQVSYWTKRNHEYTSKDLENPW